VLSHKTETHSPFFPVFYIFAQQLAHFKTKIHIGFLATRVPTGRKLADVSMTAQTRRPQRAAYCRIRQLQEQRHGGVTLEVDIVKEVRVGAEQLMGVVKR
jgi:hypothetical protein